MGKEKSILVTEKGINKGLDIQSTKGINLVTQKFCTDDE